MREIKMAIIHCSATKPSMDIGAEVIRKWHMDPKPVGNGWSDIGYHYVIRRNGIIEAGRDRDHDGNVLEEVGAHAKGFNANSLGICWIGGVSEKDVKKAEDNRTPEQMKSMKMLIRLLKSFYPKLEILGHRDLPKVAKDCPSFDVKKWLKAEKI